MWDKIAIFGTGLALGAMGAAFAYGYKQGIEEKWEEVLEKAPENTTAPAEEKNEEENCAEA